MSLATLTRPGHAVIPAAESATAGTAVSRRHGSGFWLIAFAFLTAMAFSTVPTPLYPIYMHRDGFSTFMVTIVFAVFAVGVVISLLLAGHVSDWVGRKKVLIPALGLELLATVLFLADPTLPVLLVARLVTGLGIGAITATATAHLHELHAAHRPGASGQRFEVVSTAANMGGLGIGPLTAGFLAQWIDAPLRTPYLVFAFLLLASIAAVALTPETVQVQMVKPTYRPQRISANHGDRAGYIAAAAAGFASFVLFGLFTSVAASFVAGTLHHPARALAGAVVFAVFGAAAVAQTLTAQMSAPAKMTFGVAAQSVGLITLVMAMHTANLAAFLIGGMVAGSGAGMLFKAAVGTVVAMAAPAKRSEALAGLFLFSYLGLIVPALGIGIATRSIAATTALTWLAALLLGLLAAVAILARRTNRGRGHSRERTGTERQEALHPQLDAAPV